MPRSPLLRPGCAYAFLYPRYNYEGLPPRTECRRILVESVRDTTKEPLDPTTVPSNPSLKRGRWLVTGRDLDRDAQRSFYVDSMIQLRPLSQEECEPLRDAQFLVLCPNGHKAFQTSRLAEAISFLLGRRTGVLCKILGFGPGREEQLK